MYISPFLSAVRNHIGHLTLNRPAGLNALTLEMIRQLHGQLAEWAEDPAIHAVVLRGNGEKAFCAGGDIRFLYDSFKAATSATKPSSRRNTRSTSTSTPTPSRSSR